MSTIEVLKQIFTSWQVIVITIAIILYMFLVSYVARSYHRPRTSKKAKNMFKKKQSQPVAEAGGPEEATEGADANEELGLEEI